LTLQVINTGTFPNDATGDTLQVAFGKCNTNFTALNPLGNAVATPSAGWGTPTNALIVANFNGNGATLLQTSETLAALIAVLKQAGLLAQ
jgi:hypothetical protein